MKKMKKIVSLVLAAIMVFAMTTTAFAANADLTGHTYKAYQIFSGTQTTDTTDAELGQIVWGDGVNGAALLTELKTKAGFTTCNSAADVARVLSAYADKSDDAKAFAKIAYKHIVAGTGKDVGASLTAGYYLVVDETSFETGATNTATNLALLQLTKKGTFEIDNKTSVPEVIKKVKDKDDTNGTETDWQDSADYDIGDEVPFQLTATLAGNVSDYDTYKIVFHDELSGGLDFKEGTVVIKMGESDVTSYFTVNETNGKLTISCNDVKAFNATNNSVITVEYIAYLDADAVIGSVGNPNTVQLEYSNNPNESQSGNSNTGKTPIDKVIVFTYQLDVNKVDQDKNPLAGATFKLEKKVSDAWVEVKRVTLNDAKTIFSFTGLDDGTYRLTETIAPAGYNVAEPIEFEITAQHSTEAENPILISLNGNNGVAGVLTEGDVPAPTGRLATTVINNKGAVLPETGGFGTTVFYAAGFVMMLGAAVAVYARKREEF